MESKRKPEKVVNPPQKPVDRANINRLEACLLAKYPLTR